MGFYILYFLFSRWLRLLFGREFPIQDLLFLWDVIFADGAPFLIVDFIFVTMLIFIRDLRASVLLRSASVVAFRWRIFIWNLLFTFTVQFSRATTRAVSIT